MIWGKKKNNMLSNLKAETEMETDVVDSLDKMRESSELKKFLLYIKSELEEAGVDHISYRVKTDNSAVRKIRVGKYEKTEDVDDLCGIMVVTEPSYKVYDMASVIRPILEEPDEEDLTDCYKPKGVPPLSYIMKKSMRFHDLEEPIPIEVRIQERKKFLAVESLYYTLYKNDTIPQDLKFKVENVLMKVLVMQQDLDDPKIDIGLKTGIKSDLQSLIMDNKDLLDANQNLVYEACREFTRVRFEYDYAREIEAASLFDGDILEKINDMLIKIFNGYYAVAMENKQVKESFPQAAKFDEVINRMKDLTYQEVIRLIKEEELAKKEKDGQEL